MSYHLNTRTYTSGPLSVDFMESHMKSLLPEGAILTNTVLTYICDVKGCENSHREYYPHFQQLECDDCGYKFDICSNCSTYLIQSKDQISIHDIHVTPSS